jgi:Fe-S-cluster containining protein
MTHFARARLGSSRRPRAGVLVKTGAVNAKAKKLLRFRCTGCGNCCKDPLLPLTDGDVRRISEFTGDKAEVFVKWVDRHGIDMDDEPEGFVMLRQGKRVPVLRHTRGRCHYLGEDDRCTIYKGRPLGCRVFPFDPTFGKKDGKLRHLKLIQATDCKYELDGKNDVDELRSLHERYEEATSSFHERIAEWNREQKARKRGGGAAKTARQFLEFLGLT